MRRTIPAILLIAAAALIALKYFPGITMKELTVVTIPGGASVEFNGIPSGVSPTTRFVPAEGLYVEFHRDGFYSADTLLSSTPDTLFMQLLQGCLLIVNTIPSACTVHVGDSIFVSPCSLVVPPGHPAEITVNGGSGVSVTRTVNIISPDVKVVTISLPMLYTDTTSGTVMTVIPGSLLPFSMGTLTVGRDEVTAAMFCDFMNDVDPELRVDSFTLQGRTLLMDSVLKCNWLGPVGFNSDTTGYAPFPGLEHHPVTGVTYDGARWYCSWLSERSGSGLSYRLPDAREWELLASTGGTMPVNLSDASETILTRHPAMEDGWPRTAPSGAMGYNRWGLGHMQGNVWEWTEVRGSAAGGSWLSSISDCTAESVILLEENLGYPFVGFRVVADGAPGDITLSVSTETEREI